MSRALFGPAGSSDAFSASHKSSVEMPAYLAQMGLDCFEYQCGRGVNIGRETAGKLGAVPRPISSIFPAPTPSAWKRTRSISCRRQRPAAGWGATGSSYTAAAFPK